jgi:hypothetical protein
MGALVKTLQLFSLIHSFYIYHPTPAWAYGKGWPWNPWSFTRACHGLPIYRSTPCGQTTPETTLHPFQGWPTHRAGSLQPSPTPSDTPRHTPMHIYLPRYILQFIVGRNVSKKVQTWRVISGPHHAPSLSALIPPLPPSTLYALRSFIPCPAS